MLKKLTKREKYSVLAASSVLVFFMALQFVVLPVFDKREHLVRTLHVKENILEKMIALQTEHNAIMQQSDLSNSYFDNREKGFTLFSFLDRLCGKTGIKDHLTYMKPSTTVRKNSPYKISRVEMKLQGLTLQQLTAYLHMVETSQNRVNIKRLSISKAGKQEGFIDAVLQAETFEN